MDNDVLAIKSVTLSLIIFSIVITSGLIFMTINAWSQPSPQLKQVQFERGEVLKELPDIASPEAFSNSTGANNIAGQAKSLPNYSKFGGPTSEKFGEEIDDKDLQVATNEPIQCTNSNTKIPCKGTDNSDTMIGTEGDDFIYGLNGNDHISGLGNVGGPAGYDILDGGDGSDKLYGGNDFDNIAGGIGDDSIYGEEGNDGLWGGEDDDVIEGGVGNDRLYGDSGSDTLKGGDGDDKIYHGEYTNSAIYDKGQDGSKDTVDCGDGQDEAWLNTGSDGDVAVNCEKIHGPPPKTLDDANIPDDLQAKAND